MRNYVTINGVSSLTINGLYVKDLPPITKPLMRYTKEEIDGRDGDLITRLGYSAYDKEITIGLAGDYDINEVISFFNPTPTNEAPYVEQPKVTFTFSNEPDKVYWGEILEQIDYNSLLKFKTATVKIHVQPFKYSLTQASTGAIGSNSVTKTFTNDGNIYSKPMIRILGKGTTTVSLNGTQIFSIEMGEEANFINIYTNEMEAFFNPSSNVYENANRQVTGDYSQFKVPAGSNTIAVTSTGAIQLTIYNYSRWI